MSDHVAGYLALFMGVGAGAYAIMGWRKGRIRWRGVSERADGPLMWWSAVVSAGLWSAICTGTGIYMILR